MSFLILALAMALGAASAQGEQQLEKVTGGTFVLVDGIPVTVTDPVNNTLVFLANFQIDEDYPELEHGPFISIVRNETPGIEWDIGQDVFSNQTMVVAHKQADSLYQIYGFAAEIRNVSKNWSGVIQIDPGNPWVET